jgi:hypothetical protein
VAELPRKNGFWPVAPVEERKLERDRTLLRLKSLYLNNELIGSVPTWSEAAQILSVVLRREVSGFEVMKRSSEGPDGF